MNSSHPPRDYIKWRYREFDPAGMGQAQWLIQADYVTVNGSYSLGNHVLPPTELRHEDALEFCGPRS